MHPPVALPSCLRDSKPAVPIPRRWKGASATASSRGALAGTPRTCTTTRPKLDARALRVRSRPRSLATGRSHECGSIVGSGLRRSRGDAGVLQRQLSAVAQGLELGARVPQLKCALVTYLVRCYFYFGGAGSQRPTLPLEQAALRIVCWSCALAVSVSVHVRHTCFAL